MENTDKFYFVYIVMLFTHEQSGELIFCTPHIARTSAKLPLCSVCKNFVCNFFFFLFCSFCLTKLYDKLVDSHDGICYAVVKLHL